MSSCYTPFFIKDQGISVPCGKCPFCIKRRISGWSFRMYKEMMNSTSAYFVTLTLNTDNLEFTPNNFRTLNKATLQKFFKRLRKITPKGVKIKYYAVGEYGGKRYRPHYHVILFNSTYKDIISAWKLDYKELGHVHFGSVTESSIGYCLKYVCKPSRIPLHKNDDRQPEFALMSKGLGKCYLTPAMIRWHEADMYNRMYCNAPGGKKVAMPRYFKNAIYTNEQREHIGSKLAVKFADKENKLRTEHGDNYNNFISEYVRAEFRKMHRESTRGKHQEI